MKKLNLGCGDKILPGYINVDVAEARLGKKPDVLCDLRKLTPFEDQSVDEILSVHVVEHFWRWEVVDILKEWVRVLKPGGKLVIVGIGKSGNVGSKIAATLTSTAASPLAPIRARSCNQPLLTDPGLTAPHAAAIPAPPSGWPRSWTRSPAGKPSRSLSGSRPASS